MAHGHGITAEPSIVLNTETFLCLLPHVAGTRGQGDKHTVMRRSRFGGFVGTTNPGAVFTPEPSGVLIAPPITEAEHGVEEEHGGSEGRTNEVGDTAFVA